MALYFYNRHNYWSMDNDDPFCKHTSGIFYNGARFRFLCSRTFSTDSKQHFHLLHLRSEPLFTFYRLCLTIFVCRRNFEAFYYHGSAPTRGSPDRGHRVQMQHNDSKQPKTLGGKFQE